MDLTCALCGYKGQMPALYPTQEIMRCPRCALVFWAGNGHGDVSGLYTADYFAGEEYRDYLGDKKLIQRDFARRIAALRKLKPSGRLLEIGCAYGFFLELAREHWDARGIDVAADCVAHARETLGVDAEVADFLALPDEPGRYDVICLWDTLEHLPDPVAVIERAGRWLKPGGVLVMTTNDIDSRVARMRGQKWRQIHPPTHLFYFSGETLGRAVEKAGLETVDVSYVGYTRGYKSMAYGVFALRNPRLAWVYKLMTAGGRVDFPVHLNLYDIMMYTARKPVWRAELVPHERAAGARARGEQASEA